MTTDIQLEPWELRDPQTMIDEAMGRADPSDGDLVLVLVRHPSGAQEIVDVAHHRPPDWSAHPDLSTFYCEAVNRLPVPPWSCGGDGPDHVIATVMVREGSVVFGPREDRWFDASRFSNHGCHAYNSAFFVVTEHGWAEVMSRMAGDEPRLKA